MAPRPWATLAGVWALYFAFGAGFANLPPLIAPISAELGLGGAASGAILGAWQAVFMLAALPAALVMLRIGPVRALTWAGLCVLASLALRAAAPGPWMLGAATALMGLGAPAISIGAPILVQRGFRGRWLGFATGLTVAAPALAVILNFALDAGPLLRLTGHWRGVLALWAGIGAACLGLWLLVRPAEAAPRKAGWRLARPPVRAVWPLCLAAALIFFLDHAWRSWITEIGRAAGYPLGQAGLLSSLSVAMGLLALLTLPAFAVTARARLVLAATLCATAALALAALSALPAGPGFLAAAALAGFATGPLLALGLMPVVTDAGLAPERRILTIALFFSAAQIGGTLGPLSFGALRETTGSFAAGLLAAALLALFIPPLLHLAAPRGQGGPAAGRLERPR
ncbi:MFS transporter [Roseivivax sp. CAU 1761]